MGEVQMANGFCYVSRFVRIERARLPFANGTEPTVARADVAAEHESRSSIRPAFEDVWATGFLTNRVKVEALDQLQNVVLIGRIAKPDL
jgi:hypothetical protein